jgi:hypothetical protein
MDSERAIEKNKEKVVRSKEGGYFHSKPFLKNNTSPTRIIINLIPNHERLP